MSCRRRPVEQLAGQKDDKDARVVRNLDPDVVYAIPA